MNDHESEVQYASHDEESWPRDFDIRVCRAEQQELFENVPVDDKSQPK